MQAHDSGPALLVDRDADTRQLFKMALEPLGQVVLEAEDGAEALIKALADHPALVLTETRLPHVDGYALCSLLRGDPSTRSARIVVVTAAASAAEMARAIDAGADAVLGKPCDIDELIATVQKLLSTTEAAAPAPAPEPRATTRRTSMSRKYERGLTTSPPSLPPQAFCPTCAAQLTYQLTYVGGVSERHPEQWDYFVCSTCGAFRYRHRTRKLMRVDELPSDRNYR